MEQRSARLPVTQEIVGSNPIGDARQHGAVRKLEKRRSSNLRDRLWVRLPPVLLIYENMRRLGIGEPNCL